jgi:hypothetical protein
VRAEGAGNLAVGGRFSDPRKQELLLIPTHPRTHHRTHAALPVLAMGRLVISRADCCAMSARGRTAAHITVVSTVLCTSYVVNKTVSCVRMNVILVTMI